MDRLKADIEQVFQPFGSIVHQKMYTDFKGIFKNSGNARSFLAVLMSRLKFLEQQGLEKALQTDNFKRIEKGLYAIRIKGKHNIRILFSLKENKEIMLLAFFRKAGKGRSEYENYIPEANRRLSEIKLMIPRRGETWAKKF